MENPKTAKRISDLQRVFHLTGRFLPSRITLPVLLSILIFIPIMRFILWLELGVFTYALTCAVATWGVLCMMLISAWISVESVRFSVKLAVISVSPVIFAVLISIISMALNVVPLKSLLWFCLTVWLILNGSASIGLLAGYLAEHRVFGASLVILIFLICLFSVFWVNLIIEDGSPQPGFRTAVGIDINPVVLVSAALGGDPMHTRKIYNYSEIAFYRYRYPSRSVLFMENLSVFVLCCLASWLIEQRRRRTFILR